MTTPLLLVLSKKSLDYPLSDVIAIHILEKKPLTKSHLIKLMFLLELNWAEDKNNADPLLGFIWTQTQLGPFTPSIMETLKLRHDVNTDYNLLTLKKKLLGPKLYTFAERKIDKYLSPYREMDFEQLFNHIMELEIVKNTRLYERIKIREK